MPTDPQNFTPMTKCEQIFSDIVEPERAYRPYLWLQALAMQHDSNRSLSGQTMAQQQNLANMQQTLYKQSYGTWYQGVMQGGLSALGSFTRK